MRPDHRVRSARRSSTTGRGAAAPTTTSPTKCTQPTGSPVTIEVFEGPLLTVKAGASPSTVQRRWHGQLQRTVVSPANATGLIVQLELRRSAAPNSITSTPTVTFSTDGTYNVSVQVSDSDGWGRRRHDPDHGRHVADAADHDDTGRRPGPSRPAAHGRPAPSKHRLSSGGGGQGTASHGDDPRRRPGQSATPARDPTATSPAPRASRSDAGAPAQSGSGGRPGSSTTGGRPTEQPQTADTRLTATTAHPASRRGHAGPVVTGRLISDVIPIPAGASPLVHLDRRRSRRPAAARPASGGAVGPIARRGLRSSSCSASAPRGNCEGVVTGARCASAADATDSTHRVPDLRALKPRHRSGDLPRRERPAGPGADPRAARARGRDLRVRQLFDRATWPSQATVREALERRRPGARGVDRERPAGARPRPCAASRAARRWRARSTTSSRTPARPAAIIISIRRSPISTSTRSDASAGPGCSSGPAPRSA